MNGSQVIRGLFVDCSWVVRGLFVGCSRAVQRLVLEKRQKLCVKYFVCSWGVVHKPLGYSWVFGDCSADFMGFAHTLGLAETKPLG